MQRRHFLKSAALGAGAAIVGKQAQGDMDDFGSGSDVKITKVSYYQPPKYTKPLMAQSQGVVIVECDNGMVGVGEGGSPDTVSNLAPWVIGQDPMKTEHLWQLMLRGYFYPGGRELQHALGAIDMALWDIKGKLFNTPVFNLLGGQLRNYIYCYSTGFPSNGRSVKETARACVEFGYKAFRSGGASNQKGTWDIRKQLRAMLEHCTQIREGVDGIGDWAVDFHTRHDPPHAVRLANTIEDLEPFFVEDLIRSENQDRYRLLRQQVNVPMAVGEHFGIRWDWFKMVEEDLFDYARVTLPNGGGITEFKKIMAMCETHYIGMTPHFTGPIATVALTQCLAAFSGFAMMEMLGDGPKKLDYLNDDYLDFRAGKLYPRNVPGLGVEVNIAKLDKKAEVTDSTPAYTFPTFRRPDGSYTNW
jgi:L-alanine-DL-glutamate epimerase-like enolase superfamily enzyme